MTSNLFERKYKEFRENALSALGVTPEILAAKFTDFGIRCKDSDSCSLSELEVTNLFKAILDGDEKPLTKIERVEIAAQMSKL